MKKVAVIAIVLISSFATNAQNKETRKLSSFSKISVGYAIDVFIKKGDREEARIETKGIDLDDVLTDVSGGHLKISLSGNRYRNIDVTIWVTYKSIRAVSVSAAASIVGEDEVVADGDFDIKVSAAGDLDLKVTAKDIDIQVSAAGDADLEVMAETIKASASGAGDIWIKGVVQTQVIRVSGAGGYDGFDLESKKAEVRASGGGSARVNASERLDAEASGGGSIRYKGNPRMNVSTSGGGSIKKY